MDLEEVQLSVYLALALSFRLHCQNIGDTVDTP